MTPYGARYFDQHWFRSWLVFWWHLAIIWSNFDSGIHSRVMLTLILNIPIFKSCFNFRYVKLQPYLSGNKRLKCKNHSPVLTQWCYCSLALSHWKVFLLLPGSTSYELCTEWQFPAIGSPLALLISQWRHWHRLTWIWHEEWQGRIRVEYICSAHFAYIIPVLI